jgi:hypothetical protein
MLTQQSVRKRSKCVCSMVDQHVCSCSCCDDAHCACLLSCCRPQQEVVQAVRREHAVCCRHAHLRTPRSCVRRAHYQAMRSCLQHLHKLCMLPQEQVLQGLQQEGMQQLHPLQLHPQQPELSSSHHHGSQRRLTRSWNLTSVAQLQVWGGHAAQPSSASAGPGPTSLPPGLAAAAQAGAQAAAHDSPCPSSGAASASQQAQAPEVRVVQSSDVCLLTLCIRFWCVHMRMSLV